jgi:membrane protein CcdC involved in cytochrome C biogenesis
VGGGILLLWTPCHKCVSSKILEHLAAAVVCRIAAARLVSFEQQQVRVALKQTMLLLLCAGLLRLVVCHVSSSRVVCTGVQVNL